MSGKRDQMFEILSRWPCLACPVCGEPLSREGENLSCGRGHSLNVSRQGTVNCLSAPRKDFYTAELFEARRRVFEAGWYEPAAEALERLLPGEEHRLLDAGCGEGWYLAWLLRRHPGWLGIGLDISKEAIRLAARQEVPALWGVADLRRMPLAEGSVTAVLDILTPASYESFGRVLRPDGVLIKVFPGSGYLREIREARGLPPYDDGQVPAWLRQRARVLAEERVCVTRPVPPEVWADFVRMTPMNAELTPEERQRLAERPAAAITIDLRVAACSLRNA